MLRSAPAVPALLAAAALVAGCGASSYASTSKPAGSQSAAGGSAAQAGYGYGPTTSTSTPATAPKPAAKTGRAVLKARHGKLGTYLVDAKGFTLYVFAKDHAHKSTCSGACAQVWAPLHTSGKPRAQSGVRASLLGTTRRSDGTTQVTYHGHPLYHFAADHKPGQTTGQGVTGFGAPWHVLAPSGKAITKA
jgi:predicted lipoprotein with Yx(FWY)xxD motif